MLSYEIGHSIGRDEEDFNKIYLDRPVRYKTFDLDYKKNFKAYLIAENIKFFMSKIDDISILNSDNSIRELSKVVRAEIPLLKLLNKD